ncbi:MAG: thiamine pyrophosphate-dependent enzyme [Caldilineaceae bacterium]
MDTSLPTRLRPHDGRSYSARPRAIAKGKGGSMHTRGLQHRHVGRLRHRGQWHSGGGGAGLSAKTRGTDQGVCHLFQDSAANEGSFHGQLNLASVQVASPLRHEEYDAAGYPVGQSYEHQRRRHLTPQATAPSPASSSTGPTMAVEATQDAAVAAPAAKDRR